ncbi:MAG: hypothetical protein JXR83_09475 [Deltaproteobacteria bacterium]|nr:hypothetical protein [Deltaproteobacteria bacterium]
MKKLSARVADLEAKAAPAVRYVETWLDVMKAADGDGPVAISPHLADLWQEIVAAALARPADHK